MSGLRYFADMMHETIERECNARTYEAECQRLRNQNLPFLTDRAPLELIQANEGICAVRIIMGKNDVSPR